MEVDAFRKLIVFFVVGTLLAVVLYFANDYAAKHRPTDIAADGSISPTSSTVLGSGLTPTTAADPTPTTRKDTRWKVVLNDQFNSAGIPRHWKLYQGSGAGPCVSPENVNVSGGAMKLQLAYRQSGECGPAWYSAAVTVDKTYSSIDQRVTVRWRVVPGGATGNHVVPTRWPDSDAWPKDGEESYCESGSLISCSTYLHHGENDELETHDERVELTAWNVMRFTRRGHAVTVEFNSVPVWTYTGSSSTLPDTLKRVIFQEECLDTGCPVGTTGTETIEVDYVIIENPA